MKFCAKIGSFILGVVLGIVLVFGGVGLGGYIVLTKEGFVGTIASKVDAFNPTEEVQEMSVIGYGKHVVEIVKNYSNTTFGAIEDAIGINISTSLANTLELDVSVLRTSTMSTVFDNILNGYTVSSLQTKFGFTLPNLPLFQDTVFLAKPVKDGFNYLSEQLNMDTLTVSDLQTKFGVNLGEMFESMQGTKLSELGSRISAAELHEFVDVVLALDADRYRAENVATAADVTTWTTAKTAFAPDAEGSNFGQGAYTYSRNDFASATTYFEDVFDGETLRFSAAAAQERWMAEWNATEANANNQVAEYWGWMKANNELYSALQASNTEGVKHWLNKEWIAAKSYFRAPADWAAWYATNSAENGLVAGRSEAEAKDYYFENVDSVTQDWKTANPTGTIVQYKEELFADYVTGVDVVAEAEGYMPLFAAPIKPNAVVVATEGKTPEQIATEYEATVPVPSNLALQYLYYAVVGSSGDNGLNAYMNRMTLQNVMVIGDDAHYILRQVKNSPVSQLGTRITDEINSAPVEELVVIITDADAAYYGAQFVSTEEARTAWISAQTASLGHTAVSYTDNPTTFDYFENKAQQTEWIAAQLPTVYYDEVEWETENTSWFATDSARRSAWAEKYAVDNNTTEILGAAQYDLLSAEEKASFGAVKEGINFAKPYAPTYAADYDAAKATPSEKILQSLKGTTLIGLNTTVNGLTLNQVFGMQETGVMSLVSGYTKINGLATALQTVITTKTIGELEDAGVFTINWGAWGETEPRRIAVRAQTITDVIDGYIVAVQAGSIILP